MAAAAALLKAAFTDAAVAAAAVRFQPARLGRMVILMVATLVPHRPAMGLAATQVLVGVARCMAVRVDFLLMAGRGVVRAMTLHRVCILVVDRSMAGVAVAHLVTRVTVARAARRNMAARAARAAAPSRPLLVPHQRAAGGHVV